MMPAPIAPAINAVTTVGNQLNDPAAGAVEVVTIWVVVRSVELGTGIAPTVVKLPVTQALVRLIALEHTRQ